MIQFPRAIDETALDLLNPAGVAIIPSSVISKTARIKRVNGFGFEKSSPSIACILGIYNLLAPIILSNAGRVNNSKPVKQAEGFPDKPNNTCSPKTATVVTLPGRIATLLNKTSAPNRS